MFCGFAIAVLDRVRVGGKRRGAEARRGGAATKAGSNAFSVRKRFAAARHLAPQKFCSPTHRRPPFPSSSSARPPASRRHSPPPPRRTFRRPAGCQDDNDGTPLRRSAQNCKILLVCTAEIAERKAGRISAMISRFLQPRRLGGFWGRFYRRGTCSPFGRSPYSLPPPRWTQRGRRRSR